MRYSTVDAFAFTLTTGDFNGDGKLDLAVGNTNCEDLRGSCGVSSSVAILLGKGDGTFATAVTYPSGDSLWPPPQKAGVDSNAIAASDLNGDGKVDLALSDRSVLLGNGDGTFQTAQSYNPTLANDISAVVADFNADGKPDLAVADEFNVTVLVNISSSVQQTSSTSLTSSRNPAEIHHRVTFTAKVTTTSQGTPTGSVTFSDSGYALAKRPCRQRQGEVLHLFSRRWHSLDYCQLQRRPDFPVQHITGAETGRPRGNPTRLASSQNPSRRGQAVTFTATVAANSGETPTGKITFRRFSTILATVELSGGQATFTSSTLRRGLT